MSDYPAVFRWDMAVQAIEENLPLEVNHMNPEEDQYWIRLVRADCVYRSAWYRVFVPSSQMSLELR